LRDQIDRSFRTPDGGFYHRFPGYIDQVCLSVMYKRYFWLWWRTQRP
jgi:unsaturated rhamnogalacturonyl hydrolase